MARDCPHGKEAGCGPGQGTAWNLVMSLDEQNDVWVVGSPKTVEPEKKKATLNTDE